MDYYLIENGRYFAIVEEYVLAKIKRLNKGCNIHNLYTIKKLNDDNWDNIINDKQETTNKRYTSIEDEEEIRDYGFLEE